MNRFGRFAFDLAFALLVVGLAAVAVVRAHAVNSPSEDKAIGIIFCDGFEPGDTSAWGSEDCSSTLDMSVAVSE